MKTLMNSGLILIATTLLLGGCSTDTNSEVSIEDEQAAATEQLVEASDSEEEDQNSALSRLTAEIEIAAPKEKVWQVLIGKETYTEWTKPFGEGSHFEGNWETGSTMRFLGPDKNGLVSTIVEHIPNEIVTIEHQGYVYDGVNDMDSEASLLLNGAKEIYKVSQNGETTTLTFEMDMEQQYIEWMMGTADASLAIVKELSEQ